MFFCLNLTWGYLWPGNSGFSYWRWFSQSGGEFVHIFAYPHPLSSSALAGEMHLWGEEGRGCHSFGWGLLSCVAIRTILAMAISCVPCGAQMGRAARMLWNLAHPIVGRHLREMSNDNECCAIRLLLLCSLIHWLMACCFSLAQRDISTYKKANVCENASKAKSICAKVMML